MAGGLCSPGRQPCICQHTFPPTTHRYEHTFHSTSLRCMLLQYCSGRRPNSSRKRRTANNLSTHMLHFALPDLQCLTSDLCCVSQSAVRVDVGRSTGTFRCGLYNVSKCWEQKRRNSGLGKGLYALTPGERSEATLILFCSLAFRVACPARSAFFVNLMRHAGLWPACPNAHIHI